MLREREMALLSVKKDAPHSSYQFLGLTDICPGVLMILGIELMKSSEKDWQFNRKERLSQIQEKLPLGRI